MKKSDFHFDLPPELIAQAPLPDRSDSRLLLVPPGDVPFQDRQFRDLPELLQAGDLLIFNDTRVIPARLYGQKQTGGQVEILIERLLPDQCVRAQVGASKSPKAGSGITLTDGTLLTVLGREEEFYRLRFDTEEPVETVLNRLGKMPLPPYIQRDADADDDTRYQTVFARHAGAVAAPTAGLHFDQEILTQLQAKDVQLGHITLHVGAGTFQPMRAENLKDHVMHSEWLNVGAELCAQIAATKARGGRVIAVGTTVLRALETAIVDGTVKPFAGDTQIFIFPGYRIRSIDALITNFHLPESTLLMLVSAFAGKDRIFAAYRHAVSQQYRFFSYGDAMLLYSGAAP
ncbi:MAG: tRNA preQ1(34) S-adenosylmethionine ribosyltransferase-isomerase QueA [Xanthomonadaceae bacterium]|nr:tRNA preQ1(34) S-adenosylmethionine ribosyltransferase-isomerase QueA [Xanthomonadaceae bacterium]